MREAREARPPEPSTELRVCFNAPPKRAQCPLDLRLAVLVSPSSVVVCRPTEDLPLARPHDEASPLRIDARYGGRRNNVPATGGPAAGGDDDAHSFVVDAINLADGPSRASTLNPTRYSPRSPRIRSFDKWFVIWAPRWVVMPAALASQLASQPHWVTRRGKDGSLQRASFRRVLPPPQTPKGSAIQRGWVGGRCSPV